MGLERLGSRLPAARGSLLKLAAVPGPLTLATARASLEAACDDLDEAVGGLSDDGDAVMASPALVALLLRVVGARRDLRGVEGFMEARALDRPRNETRQ
jgi:hypothetical protein